MSLKYRTKVSDNIEAQLPNFINSEFPKFKQLLERYYEFMESIKIDYTLLDGSNFKVGDIVTGENSGSTAIVKGVDSSGSSIYVEQTSKTLFQLKEILYIYRDDVLDRDDVTYNLHANYNNNGKRVFSLDGNTQINSLNLYIGTTYLFDFSNLTNLNSNFYISTDNSTWVKNEFNSEYISNVENTRTLNDVLSIKITSNTNKILYLRNSKYPTLIIQLNIIDDTKSVSRINVIKSNALDLLRRIEDLQNLDENSQDIILTKIKKEIVDNFPDSKFVDDIRFIKNLTDFYKTKGTIESYNYLFKTLFNKENLEISYPKISMIKLSNAKWEKNTILKLKEYKNPSVFVGSLITGQTSGATGFVERIDQYNVKEISILEIIISENSVVGEFLDGEEIITQERFGITGSGITVSSLSDVVILNNGTGYEVGQEIPIISEGIGGKIVITSTSQGNLSGLLIFDGGIGYKVGDELIFNDIGTGGSGGSGIVTSIFPIETLLLNSDIIRPLAGDTLNTTPYPNLKNSADIDTHLYSSFTNTFNCLINDTTNIFKGDILYNETNDMKYTIISVELGNKINFSFDYVDDNIMIEDDESSSIILEPETDAFYTVLEIEFPGTEYADLSPSQLTVFENALSSYISNNPETNKVITETSLLPLVFGDILNVRDSSLTTKGFDITIQNTPSNVLNSLFYGALNFNSTETGSITSVLLQDSGSLYSSFPGISVLNSEYNQYNSAPSKIEYPSYVMTINNTDDIDTSLIGIGTLLYTYDLTSSYKVVYPISNVDGSDNNKLRLIRLFGDTNFTSSDIFYEIETNRFVGSGSSTTFTLNSIVQDTHTLRVIVSGTELSSSEFSYVDDNITLNVAPNLNDKIVIYHLKTQFNISDFYQDTNDGNNAVITPSEFALGSIRTVSIESSGINYGSSSLIDTSSIGDGNAELQLVTSTLTSTDGQYTDLNSVLSQTGKIQDNYFYQEYSYVINTDFSINIYRDIVKDILHPSGLALFGVYTIENFCSTYNLNNDATKILKLLIMDTIADVKITDLKSYIKLILSNEYLSEDGIPSTKIKMNQESPYDYISLENDPSSNLITEDYYNLTLDSNKLMSLFPKIIFPDLPPSDIVLDMSLTDGEYINDMQVEYDLLVDISSKYDYLLLEDGSFIANEISTEYLNLNFVLENRLIYSEPIVSINKDMNIQVDYSSWKEIEIEPLINVEYNNTPSITEIEFNVNLDSQLTGISQEYILKFDKNINLGQYNLNYILSNDYTFLYFDDIKKVSIDTETMGIIYELNEHIILEDDSSILFEDDPSIFLISEDSETQIQNENGYDYLDLRQIYWRLIDFDDSFNFFSYVIISEDGIGHIVFEDSDSFSYTNVYDFGRRFVIEDSIIDNFSHVYTKLQYPLIDVGQVPVSKAQQIPEYGILDSYKINTSSVEKFYMSPRLSNTSPNYDSYSPLDATFTVLSSLQQFKEKDITTSANATYQSWSSQIASDYYYNEIYTIRAESNTSIITSEDGSYDGILINKETIFQVNGEHYIRSYPTQSEYFELFPEMTYVSDLSDEEIRSIHGEHLFVDTSVLANSSMIVVGPVQSGDVFSYQPAWFDSRFGTNGNGANITHEDANELIYINKISNTGYASTFNYSSTRILNSNNWFVLTRTIAT